MPVDHSTLSKAISAVKQTYGDKSVMPASAKPKLRRIPTGSIELDAATGGGIPLGRWCHFYGPKSSGKTLTAYNIISASQSMGLNVAYYNAEKQFDPAWAKKHGIDTDALQLVDGTVIEEIGAKLETFLGSINVHVIDSLAACIAEEELKAKTEEWRPGISARTWGKVIRRCNNFFDDAENTIIMVNQTRTQFGYGAGEEPTNGKAIEYISRLSLAFRRSHWLYYNKDGVLDPKATAGATLTGDREPDGIEFQARLTKSSGFGKQDATARMRLDYATGEYDDIWSLSKAAIHHGLVVRESPKSAWYRYGEKKVQGQNGVRELIETDAKLAMSVRKKLLAAA